MKGTFTSSYQTHHHCSFLNFMLWVCSALSAVRACLAVTIEDDIDTRQTISSVLEALGASIQKKVNSATTHVICHDGSDPSSLAIDKNVEAALNKGDIHIVSVLWVNDCMQENSHLNEDPYTLELEKPSPAESLTKKRRRSRTSLVKPAKDPGNPQDSKYSSSQREHDALGELDNNTTTPVSQNRRPQKSSGSRASSSSSVSKKSTPNSDPKQSKNAETKDDSSADAAGDEPSPSKKQKTKSSRSSPAATPSPAKGKADSTVAKSTPKKGGDEVVSSDTPGSEKKRVSKKNSPNSEPSRKKSPSKASSKGEQKKAQDHEDEKENASSSESAEKGKKKNNQNQEEKENADSNANEGKPSTDSKKKTLSKRRSSNKQTAASSGKKASKSNASKKGGSKKNPKKESSPKADLRYSEAEPPAIVGITKCDDPVLSDTVQTLSFRDFGKDTERQFIFSEEPGNITHLVLGGKCQRTLKLLYAFAQGSWILEAAWAYRSLEAGYPVYERDYFANLNPVKRFIDLSVRPQSFNKSSSQEFHAKVRESAGSTFSDKLFYLDGSVSSDMPIADFGKLLNAAGAQWINHSQPETESLDAIIVSKKTRPKREAVLEGVDENVPVITTEWVLRSIMSAQALAPDRSEWFVQYNHPGASNTAPPSPAKQSPATTATALF